MRIPPIGIAAIATMANANAGAQELEHGEWKMFGAPMPENQDTDYEWSHSFWIAPVWFYNTRTGTVYRVVGDADIDSHGCGEDDDVAPCIDYSLVPVPVVEVDLVANTVSVVEREPQSGDWRMFARESSTGNIYYQDDNFGAWLYNAFTGAVYEVRAVCDDEDFSVLAGCMAKVPVKDTYNQPAMLDPNASGLP